MNNLLIEENLILKDRSFAIDLALGSLFPSMCQEEYQLKQTKEYSKIIIELAEENEKIKKTIEKLTLYNAQVVAQASSEIKKKHEIQEIR